MILYWSITKTFLKQIMMGYEKWILYNVEWKRSWGEQNEPPPTAPKAGLLPKKVLLCVRWDRKGALYYELLPEDQSMNSKYCSQSDQLKAALDEECPELAENSFSSIRITQDCMFAWWPGKNCYSLVGEFWFICLTHQTLHLRISIYFGSHKIFFMGKISIP